MTLRYNLNEIFPSIQGEGIELGKPVVFVRLAGCNRKCTFCDTKHSLVWQELPALELAKVVASYGIPSVVITGGEPAMVDLLPLLEALKDKGLSISIETNGDYKIKPIWVEYLTTIAIAPKSFQTLMDWAGGTHLMYNSKKYIFKLLHPMFSEADISTFLEVLYKQGYIDPPITYVMPINEEKKIIEKNSDNSYTLASRLAGKYPKMDVRWGTQFHKLLGVK